LRKKANFKRSLPSTIEGVLCGWKSNNIWNLQNSTNQILLIGPYWLALTETTAFNRRRISIKSLKLSILAFGLMPGVYSITEVWQRNWRYTNWVVNKIIKLISHGNDTGFLYFYPTYAVIYEIMFVLIPLLVPDISISNSGVESEMQTTLTSNGQGQFDT
jgi:hypothetical protein